MPPPLLPMQGVSDLRDAVQAARASERCYGSEKARARMIASMPTFCSKAHRRTSTVRESSVSCLRPCRCASFARLVLDGRATGDDPARGVR